MTPRRHIVILIILLIIEIMSNMGTDAEKREEQHGEPVESKGRQLLEAKLLETAQSVFQHANFRPYQLEAMIALSEGRDVLLVLPTSGGKSLVYSLPPVSIPGTFSVVITPLLSLAKNQVRSLDEEFGVDAHMWSSETPLASQKKLAADLMSEHGSVQVLFTTPESLERNQLLRDALSIASDMGKMFCVAVDEAHVVDPWGTDFRPSYLKLAYLIQALNNVPVYACTATANQDSQDRICEVLCLKKCVSLIGGFDRPEIQLNVCYKELLDQSARDPTAHAMAAFLQENRTTGIIYCRNRITCDRVASILNAQGIESVLPYHAGLSQAERQFAQTEWEDGNVQCLVCTIAFGLGINKTDVRWVLHYEPPLNLEEYYQQIGRAGRDGQAATTILYVSHADIEDAKRRDKKGEMMAIEEYVYSGTCRRKLISQYFGGTGITCTKLPEEHTCDICRKSSLLSLAQEKILTNQRSPGAPPVEKADDESPLKRIRHSVLQKLGALERLPASDLKKKSVLSGFIKP